jgi:hypothetical protein
MSTTLSTRIPQTTADRPCTVDGVNPQYNRFCKIMIRANDCNDGEDKIKEKGETYLPMLEGMRRSKKPANLYNVYLTNAIFYPATGRTVKAYLGIMFKKSPVLVASETMQEYSKQITFGGQDIEKLAIQCAKDVILNTRCALFVDYPAFSTEGMTQAQAENLGLRPYIIFYPQTTIIDWVEAQSWGHKELRKVVLQETHRAEQFIDLPKGTLIDSGFVTTRRELALERSENGDIYFNRLYVKTENARKDTEWVMTSESAPMMNGKTLNFIPIVPCSITGEWDLDYPVINDVVTLNLADYRNEALYRDCLLFLGRPTPCVAGLMIDDEEKEIAFGSGVALRFTEGGNWGVLGGSAESASALKNESAEMKRNLAVIGSRALASDPNGVEAAQTAEIHRAGENGILSQISGAVSEAITQAMRIVAMWAGQSDDLSYTLSTDYVHTKMDTLTLQAVFAQYLAGEIPLSVFYNALNKSDLLPANMTIETFEQEQAENKANRGTSMQDIV